MGHKKRDWNLLLSLYVAGKRTDTQTCGTGGANVSQTLPNGQVCILDMKCLCATHTYVVTEWRKGVNAKNRVSALLN